MEKALGGGCDVGQGAEGDTGGEQTQVGNILTYLESANNKKSTNLPALGRLSWTPGSLRTMLLLTPSSIPRAR